MTKELKFNTGTATEPLERFIKNEFDCIQFKEILTKLTVASFNQNQDAYVKMRRFINIFNNKGAASIDRRANKANILCSARINYAKLGNILILDGTNAITRTLYSGYEFKDVLNKHNCKKRLFLRWRIINTSAEAREGGSRDDCKGHSRY
ncbi:hypothetical protein CFI03_007015 [Paenibacillus sp. ATY16]|nr:hypothetical protein [Paenibacillus sp. ATY16]